MHDTTTSTAAPADVTGATATASERLPQPRSAAAAPAQHPDEYWDLARCTWVRSPGH